MFIRQIQIFRLLSLQNRNRLFSTTNIRFNLKSEENSIVNKTEQNDHHQVQAPCPEVRH